MITLRPYQEDLVDRVRAAYREKAQSPLLQLATGGGKTLTFSAITHGAQARGHRVLILAHRIELVDQISAALREAGVRHGIIAADYACALHDVMVASVQTLVRRLMAVPPPDLIVIDECHHVSSGGTWHKILSHFASARRLGVTATPVRQDGKGLGEHFDRLICGPTTAELIDMGYLARPRIFAPPTIDTAGLHVKMGDYVQAEAEARADTPTVTGDAIATYRKHADGKPAIVFATSVAHAEHVATAFRAAGYKALSLNGGTGRDVRRMAVEDYRRGAIQIMTSCDIFSEGFDLPGIHAAIMLRPTSSLGLFLQQIGRALRTAPGKTEALILDHAGNCLRHGLPTDPRDWHLTYDETHAKKKPALSVRVCPACFAANSSRSQTCTNCGKAFEVKSREVSQVEGELIELTPEAVRARKDELLGRAKSLAELQAFGAKMGYAPGWAKHKWKGRQETAKKYRSVPTVYPSHEEP